MRTFSVLVLAILGLFFVACDNDDDHLGDWAKATEYSGKPRNQAVSFVIGDYAYVGLGYGVDQEEFKDFKKYNVKNGTWSDVADNFPGFESGGKFFGRHGAVAFVAELNGKTYAYVGLGYISPGKTNAVDRQKQYLNDFYRFDPETETWTSVASFPTIEGRRDAVAFAVNNYGYVGTGRGDKNVIYKDFYRYDPKTDKWSGDLGFIGSSRYGGTAFVVGGAAYVCLGTSGAAVLDVIKFTPGENGDGTWSAMGALADKPGVSQDKDYGRIPRVFAVTFNSNKGDDGEEYAYIATGSNNATVWRYNHKRDQWHQMEDLSQYAVAVSGAVGFSIGGYGYYTTGGAGIDQVVTSSVAGFFAESWRFIPDVKEDRANDYSVTLPNN